jgi:cyclopropane fatty-acyl-phospholipid synthase-like methyltransferase
MQHHTCPWWLGYALANPFRRLMHEPEKILAPFVREGMTVLDLGSGMGFFSLAMATLVGAQGKVICVDLQQEMLDALHRRAKRAGLSERIILQRVAQDDMHATGPVDFALAFWMAHEVADVRKFLGQVHAALKPSGSVLLVEPRIHVTERVFQNIIAQARDAGFSVGEAPFVSISRSAILRK